jgi:F-type H+-transporting ATPase subunit a
MAAEQLTPTEYINHHLAFMAEPIGTGGFWTLHVDSLVVSVLLGIVGVGLFWLVARGATAGVPSKRQAFVELCFDFIDEQVKGIFHGERHKFVAPTFPSTAFASCPRPMSTPPSRWRCRCG